jgi:hypothetical protein
MHYDYKQTNDASAAAAMKWDEDAERVTATIFLYLFERAEHCRIHPQSS